LLEKSDYELASKMFRAAGERFWELYSEVLSFEEHGDELAAANALHSLIRDVEKVERISENTRENHEVDPQSARWEASQHLGDMRGVTLEELRKKAARLFYRSAGKFRGNQENMTLNVSDENVGQKSVRPNSGRSGGSNTGSNASKKGCSGDSHDSSTLSLISRRLRNVLVADEAELEDSGSGNDESNRNIWSIAMWRAAVHYGFPLGLRLLHEAGFYLKAFRVLSDIAESRRVVRTQTAANSTGITTNTHIASYEEKDSEKSLHESTGGRSIDASYLTELRRKTAQAAETFLQELRAATDERAEDKGVEERWGIIINT
jgi:hypothetical protein